MWPSLYLKRGLKARFKFYRSPINSGQMIKLCVKCPFLFSEPPSCFHFPIRSSAEMGSTNQKSQFAKRKTDLRFRLSTCRWWKRGSQPWEWHCHKWKRGSQRCEAYCHSGILNNYYHLSLLPIWKWGSQGWEPHFHFGILNYDYQLSPLPPVTYR